MKWPPEKLKEKLGVSDATSAPEGIREILQRDIASEVWYESRINDERLQKGLTKAEKELESYCEKRIAAAREQFLKNNWTKMDVDTAIEQARRSAVREFSEKAIGEIEKSVGIRLLDNGVAGISRQEVLNILRRLANEEEEK